MATSTTHRGNTKPSRTQQFRPLRLNILDGLERPELETLQKPETRATESVTIRDVEYIGSYNWLDQKKPTIVVPGSPRRWLNRDIPYQVPPDAGTFCTYEDGQRVPSYPMLPWFYAIDTVTGQAMDWGSVDFITSRNTLRKLLRWTRESKPDDFRIDTQLAGERTVVFGQWVERMRMKSDSRHPGYGRNFEHESTGVAPGCENLNMTAHTRLVKYNFGGLTMVVGFEVDAYTASASPSNSPLITNGGHSATTEPMTHADKSYVNVVNAGGQIPQADIVEIKTGKKMKWKETYPQLFLSQTPHLYAASHEQGLFRQVRMLGVDDPEMREVAEELQNDFVKLRDTLIDIRNTLRRHKQSTRLSLLCQKGNLQVFRMKNANSCLPEAILERFEGGLNESYETAVQ
ncbi:uncharacterized protein B0H18DRAFT_1028382 [Fomitopsis serialis]|uniref:uncharacterized protein n=1 Tax=Fomitopsis serialis TaxID=139415 RepID=UPI002007A99F|nr:uncharacterized protein B0H18DRAFT_1028382 [Neoantrodia serialis]KAH9919324.1 hypothetical protein B0H18DRAFT_1028382 [Neoantrodia serialis]